MPTATVTSKGQITIPIEVRNALKLKAGDKLDFFETEGGEWTFQAKTGSIESLKGILQKLGYAPLGYAPAVEEMDEAIEEYAVESDDATLSSTRSHLDDEHAA
jgi:antitoxin PrlF